MIIDVEPIVEKATGIWRIACDLYQEPRFVVKQENGKFYSAVFTQREIDNFVPSKTASEMLTAWETGIARRYDTFMMQLETGLMPKKFKVMASDIFTKEEVHVGTIMTNQPITKSERKS